MDYSLDIRSIIIYLFLFSVSLLFVGAGEHFLIHKNGTICKGQRRIIGILLVSFALLLLCVFAAFRGETVGRDISTYIINNFQYGQQTGISFAYYLQHMPVKTEPLFALMLYSFSKIGNLHLLLFCIQALIMIPLTIVMIKERGNGSLVLEFTIFFFLFFNFTLSGMRQSIAMGFLLCALHDFTEKKKVKPILLLCIAQLFHSSIILIIALICICNFIVKARHRKKWLIIFVGTLIIVFFSFSFFSEKLANFVARINPRYGFFISQYTHAGYNFGDVPSTDVLFKTLLVFIPMSSVLKSKRITIIDKQMLFFVLLGRYFVLFNGVFYESMRIAFYFDYFIILYVPRCIAGHKNKFNRVSIQTLCIGMAALYWLYFIMYVGGYGTNLVIFSV